MRILFAAALLLTLAGCMERPWIKHDYPEWGFTAWFPSEPVTRQTTATHGGKSTPSFVVEGAGQDEGLTVQVSDLTGVDHPVDALVAEAIRASGDGKPVRMTYWALSARGQHMGRAGLVEEGGGMVKQVHVLVAYGRLYQVSARSLGTSSPKAKEFLESFQLIEPAAASQAQS